MQLYKYIPSEDENIVIHGRTCRTVPLPLLWTGSGIELNTDGTELYFEIETDYSIYEQWIRILINNYTMIRMPLPKGISMVCAFRGTKSDSIKNVRLIKEVQPMQYDPASFLKIHSVQCNGKLYPVKKRKYKIEFVGDSITSGEGLAGPRDLIEWIPMVFSTEGNYAVQVAEVLDADYRIISQSGWGVYAGWNNDPNKALPKHYTKICSVLSDENNKRLGTCQDYDFSEWKANAVVVNLGSNDMFAFNKPEWIEPGTGKVYKLRLEADGSYNAEDTEKIHHAVYEFIKLIRKCNKDAYILWTFGMMGRGLQPYIEDAVSAFIRDTNDHKVSFALLLDIKDEWIGANNHPNAQSHAAAARVIAEKLLRLNL